jgi:AcrR family transcriptional regulator
MTTKERLIEAGLRMLEAEGPEALNARKLAAAIGASTMTVYTHFGGMAGLYDALIRRAFLQFGDALAEVKPSDDPVADVFVLGLTYREFALASPQRFRFMFGVTAPGSGAAVAQDLTNEGSPSGMPEMSATFDHLVEAVRRALEAGRIRGDDPVPIAGQFWSMIHGFVLLEMTGFFGTRGEGVPAVLAPLASNVLLGLGDDPAKLEKSAQKGYDWLASRERTPTIQPTMSVRRGRRPRRE